MREDASERLFGRKPVLEAFRAGTRRVSHLYLQTGVRDELLDQIESHARARGVEIHRETRRRLDQLAGTENHQGVVAVCERRPALSLEDLLAESRRRGEPPFLLVLDEIEDPQNLGAILRSAEAAGCHGVVAPKRRSAPLSGAVSKASAGAADHVPFCQVTNVADALRRLKKEGVWVYGAAVKGEKPFFKEDFTGPTVLVVGNEGRGLRRLVQETCDRLVVIPQRGKVASLNASVAAALLLFEVVRQRHWKLPEPAPPPPREALDFFRGALLRVLRARMRALSRG